jgi:hypothetical protein
MTELLLVHAHLDKIWPAALPWINRACEENGEWTPEQIGQGIAAGQMQLWILWNDEKPACLGAFVTRIQINNKGEKIGRDVLMSADNLPEHLGTLEQIERFFADMGCSKIQFQTRKGLARHLKEYRIRQVVLERTIKNVLGQREHHNADHHESAA